MLNDWNILRIFHLYAIIQIRSKAFILTGCLRLSDGGFICACYIITAVIFWKCGWKLLIKRTIWKIGRCSYSKKRKFWEDVDKERPDHPLIFCNFRNTFTWIYCWKATVFSRNWTERCPKASLSEPIMAQCRYDTSLTRLPGAFAFLSSIFTEFWAVSILFVLNASQEICKTSKTKLALDRQCLSVHGMYCILSYPTLLHCR